MSFVGNLLLVPIGVLLFGVFSRTRAAALFFAPVVALVFAPHSWENLIWPTASVQNYGVLLFALLSLQQFSSGGWRGLGLSLVLATCATLTSVSGLLVFPVLALWASTRVFDARRDVEHERGSRWLALGTVLVVGLVIGTLFFLGHARPPHSSMLAAALQRPLEAAVRVAVVLGSFANVQRLIGSTPLANGIALAAGVAVLAFFLYLVRRGFARSDPLLFHFACFLILCAGFITAGRATIGVRQAMSSRYVIFSASTVSALYLAWLGMADLGSVTRRRMLGGALALALAYLTLSTVESVPKLTERCDGLTAGMRRWVETGAGLVHSEPERVDPILRRAIADGSYRPPQ